MSSFSALFTSTDYYHQSVQCAGLQYISVGVGYSIGSLMTSQLNARLYRRLKKRNDGEEVTEYRIPVLIPCTILLPLGRLVSANDARGSQEQTWMYLVGRDKLIRYVQWYGWSAYARLHWIMPDIGVALLSGAQICGYQAVQTYVIDVFTTYAASAVAAIVFLRSLAGFGFPLFAPALYGALGCGCGNTLLAGVAIVLGIPAPWIFWHYGARLRAKSQYAAG